MGQKSNPINLRLNKTNQHWNSCWYGDYNYTAQFMEDCRLSAYIQNICQQGKKKSPVILFKRERQQIEIALFLSTAGRQRRGKVAPSIARDRLKFTDDKKIPATIQPKEWKCTALRFLLHAILYTTKSTAAFVEPKLHHAVMDLQSSVFPIKLPSGFVEAALLSVEKMYQREERIVHQPTIVSNRLIQHLVPTQLNRHCAVAITSWAHVEENRRKKYMHRFINKKSAIHPFCYKNHLEKSVSTNISVDMKYVPTDTNISLGTNISMWHSKRCKLYFFKCAFPHQHPLFLAKWVVSFLQERFPFRRLKDRLIRECISDQRIKGVRVQCSGRVATRSKKAQKALTDSIQWGEIKAHVFSEMVHFASKSAQTTFGKIGVKVWICYKT